MRKLLTALLLNTLVEFSLVFFTCLFSTIFFVALVLVAPKEKKSMIKILWIKEIIVNYDNEFLDYVRGKWYTSLWCVIFKCQQTFRFKYIIFFNVNYLENSHVFFLLFYLTWFYTEYYYRIFIHFLICKNNKKYVYWCFFR